MLESLFNKVAGTQVFSCEICKIVKNTNFYRALPLAASVFQKNSFIENCDQMQVTV